MYNTQDSIAKASIQLLLKEPFYGHIMSMLVKKVNNDVATLGLCFTTDERIELHINETFWFEMQAKPDYQYASLKHEILHFVFKHLLMMDAYQHTTIFNIAADLVVNQFIRVDQLPEGALTLNLFPGLELSADQGVKYYYDKLLNLYHKNISDESSENPDWNQLKNLLNKYPEVLKSHDLWKPPASDAQKQIINHALDTIITQSSAKLSATQRYSLPDSLQLQIKLSASRNTALVNWRRVMRLFTTNSSKTYMKNSIRRASKRYGTVPGNKINKRNKILVAIDSSGSISESEYKVFFSELYHVYKTGAEIRVVECDAKITNIYNYRGHTPETVSGGGGTDFNAPLAYANTQWLPDAIIYFTDGFASTPEVQPRASVLWVISQQGLEPDSEHWDLLPGKKIRISA